MACVSIIIVSWNVAEDLRECLNSAEAASKGLEVEIIVVDNGSSDNTVEMLRSDFPHVHVIQNSVNLGFAKANNQGIALARGRYILFLNPDTVVREDTFTRCIKYMDENPHIGMLGCKVMYPSGQIQYECARNFPALWALFLEAMYLHMIFPKSRLFGYTNMTYWSHEDSRYVPCIVGAFMLIRREVLNEVGGFDENVPMYLDDGDLCYRVSQTKWRIFYLASTHIVHKGGRSEAKASRVIDPIAAEARYQFFLKHHNEWAAFLYRLIALWQAVFRLSLSIVLFPLRFLLPQNHPVSRGLRISRNLALMRWCFGLGTNQRLP